MNRLTVKIALSLLCIGVVAVTMRLFAQEKSPTQTPPPPDKIIYRLHIKQRVSMKVTHISEAAIRKVFVDYPDSKCDLLFRRDAAPPSEPDKPIKINGNPDPHCAAELLEKTDVEAEASASHVTQRASFTNAEALQAFVDAVKQP